MASDQEHSGELQPRIRRGRVDSLTLYEVTDHELDLLEKGSPSSLYLNFACALIPTGISFWTALATSTITGKTFDVFVILTVIGILVGLILLALWWRTRAEGLSVIRTIKDRIPKEQLASSSSGALPLLPASSATDSLDTERKKALARQEKTPVQSG